MANLRDLVDSGRAIHERLEHDRRRIEARVGTARSADSAHVPRSERVGPHELPVWYLRCFRTLLATYGKESGPLQQWNDFLRAARDARPDLNLNDPLEVVRAGADDLAQAIELLGRIASQPPSSPGRRPTITVGR